MFYTYSQNNSGGHFDVNDSVCEYVIVEADSAKEANSRAELLGIYFYGCSRGWDCSCCGDRWNSICDDEDGDAVPSIYGEPLDAVRHWVFRKQAYVCHKDGRKEVVVFPES